MSGPNQLPRRHALLEWHTRAAGALVIAAMVVGVLCEFLLGDGTEIPSHRTGDTATYFITARGFASEQILAGNLPLWNPHTFSGTPFIGVFQSSVFSPLTALHLLLPPGRAFSLEFALDLFLLGLFSFLWLRGWKLHWIASCFGATIVIFGGTCILRVMAGQLTVLGTFVWVPLVLLAVDRLADRPSLGWTLMGITGVSLMLLAGHPPTSLMAGLTIALYCIPAVLGSGGRARLLGSLGCIPLGAFFVSAAQLWTGLDVASEAARGEGMSYLAATALSMPPENLVTLVAPDFFGDGPAFRYFGRWWYWDVSAFVGCAALALAIHGALSARSRLRSGALALVIVLTAFALGRYTPIYQVLYELLPGFAYLRAPSKFMFFACLFLSALAAIGTDHLLKGDRHDRRSSIVTGGVALLLLTLACWQWLGSLETGALEAPTRALAALAGHRPLTATQAARWDAHALTSLLWASGLLSGVTLLLWLAPGRRWPALVLVGVGTIELLTFAQASHSSNPLQDPLKARSALQKAYARAGQNRVLEPRLATNAALAAGGYNIWGYDPIFLRRYGEFIAFTQGRSLADVIDNNRGRHPDRFHPLLSMLRVGLQANRDPVEHANPLPRALLVQDHRIERSPSAVLAAMAEPGFEPHRRVILERPPRPLPDVQGRNREPIRLTDVSPERLRVEVKVGSPALLVVTDAYASGWHARSLPGSSQGSYEVLRANAVLRAVPLEAGDHRFELVYSPLAFRAGVWASTISTAALVVLAGLRWWSRPSLQGTA